MWISSDRSIELPNSARSGLTSITRPPTSRKPPGWFIQALTEITVSDPVKPVIKIGMPLARCQRGGIRSQP
jgi:hypothetical protein